MQFEFLVDAGNTLGEGPLWDTQEQRLYWIDSLGNTVNRCQADGSEVESWSVPANIGSLALREQGGGLVALQTGFHFLDFETGECEFITDPEADNPGTRFNDGKVDRRGRMIAGCMDYDEKSGSSGLYRLDADLSCHKLDDGIVVSNGPCWSPDDKTFYFADTWQAIYAYDYDIDAGTVANKRVFVPVEDESLGVPDGATVDAEGFVWSAQVYGAKLNRYAPDGRLDRSIDFPIQNITSVMFGGENLDTLFVTSMGHQPVRGKKSTDPRNGGVFAVHGLGVQGLPEHRFAG
ncbi:SMP-30/gluconolactonase/LRE family protein [Salinisphaera sp. SPP-AMP-43]|uniref:SMP-30/gluconolactonase/LRE family protein n=1 Tax=Salinisphaera sp. SPP-AMP-43 TaxID=3121288 RepID=UPI003C6E9DF0